jgi:hypothetical protein
MSTEPAWFKSSHSSPDRDSCAAHVAPVAHAAQA